MKSSTIPERRAPCPHGDLYRCVCGWIFCGACAGVPPAPLQPGGAAVPLCDSCRFAWQEAA